MAWTHIQAAEGSVNPGTSVNITLSATVQGNLVIVCPKFATSTANVTSVTDNKGNTYIQTIAPVYNSNLNFQLSQWIGVQVTGGVTTVTVNLDSSHAIRASAQEFHSSVTSFTSNSGIFDVGNSNNNTVAGTSTSVSLSPTNSGELIAVGLQSGTISGVTAGTGYTIGATGLNLNTEYKLSGTVSETPSMSWTGSTQTVIQAGAYTETPVSGQYYSALTTLGVS